MMTDNSDKNGRTDRQNSTKNWNKKLEEKLEQPDFKFFSAEGLVSLFESFNQDNWDSFLRDLALNPLSVQFDLHISSDEEPDVYIQTFLTKLGQQTHNLISQAIENILTIFLKKDAILNEKNESLVKTLLFIAFSTPIEIKSPDILKQITQKEELPVHLRFRAASIIRNQRERVGEEFWKQIATSKNGFELAPISIAALARESPRSAIELLGEIKKPDRQDSNIFLTPLRILFEELIDKYRGGENFKLSKESFPDWAKENIEKLLKLNYFRELKNKFEWQKNNEKNPDESGAILEAGRKILKDNDCFSKNSVFRKFIENYLADINEQLKAVGSEGKIYSFPLELYPRYLVSLQQQFGDALSVQAVAIIEDVERFWASDEGDEIGRTANPDSERLFVFSDEDKYNKSTKFLLEHASRYKVYVTTLNTYLPLAQEFSIKQKLAQWQNEDYSLPTKEYATFNTSDGGQLLVWYDEDNIKGTIDKRLANCSAISEQVSLYKNAFEFLKKAQGVFFFSVTQKTIIDNLEQLKKGLFQQTTPYESSLTPKGLLEDLQEVRNKLISLNNKDKIIQSALEIVRERLHCQTASIFLHGKDGRYHRAKIIGVDAEGKSIGQYGSVKH